MGAAVFSAGAAKPSRLIALAAGFGIAAWVFRGGYPPDAATVAGIAAIIAGCGIYRPGWIALPAFFGGALAAILGALVASQGVTEPLALVVAASIPVAALAVSAPAPVLEEGRLLILALGLGAAVVPAILDGWRSAGAMNGTLASDQVMPVWVLSVAIVSVLIGGAWSVWRHQ